MIDPHDALANLAEHVQRLEAQQEAEGEARRQEREQAAQPPTPAQAQQNADDAFLKQLRDANDKGVTSTPAWF